MNNTGQSKRNFFIAPANTENICHTIRDLTDKIRTRKKVLSILARKARPVLEARGIYLCLGISCLPHIAGSLQ